MNFNGQKRTPLDMELHRKISGTLKKGLPNLTSEQLAIIDVELEGFFERLNEVLSEELESELEE